MGCVIIDGKDLVRLIGYEDFLFNFEMSVSYANLGKNDGENWVQMTSGTPPDGSGIWLEALTCRLELYEGLKKLEFEKVFNEMVDRFVEVFERNYKVLLFGNGGSAADAQHAAAEWVGRFLTERQPLPAVALTADSSVLTAIGNDYSFEQIFERQIRALGMEGDIAFAISTTGRSENVLRSLRVAKERGMFTVALLGCDGGDAKKEADLSFIVPNFKVPLIQEAQRFILHLLCEEIDRRLEYGNIR